MCHRELLSMTTSSGGSLHRLDPVPVSQSMNSNNSEGMCNLLHHITRKKWRGNCTVKYWSKSQSVCLVRDLWTNPPKVHRKHAYNDLTSKVQSSVKKKRHSRPSVRTIYDRSTETLHLKGSHMLSVIVCQNPLLTQIRHCLCLCWFFLSTSEEPPRRGSRGAEL